MAISAKDVMALRQATGLGMMECKQALTEADGDIEKAKDAMRAKGLAKMDSRADRSSAEGRVAAARSDDGAKAAIVEINTETDFTANNDQFKEMVAQVAGEALSSEAGEVTPNDAIQAAIDQVRLTTKENVQFGRGVVVGGGATTVGTYVHFNGKVGAVVELEGEGINDELLADLCMHVTAAAPSPIAIDESGVPADVIDKEREIAKTQAIEQGKPENIAKKIVEGKIRKFFEEYVLLKQPFVKDDKLSVCDILPAGVTIKSFTRMQVGGAG